MPRCPVFNSPPSSFFTFFALATALSGASFRDSTAILSDPYLNLPTADGITVAWFTEGPTTQSFVRYGDPLAQQQAAVSSQMSRLYEDGQSEWSSVSGLQQRDIWRHEAVVTGLPAGARTPYQAVSEIDGVTYESAVFSFQPLPPAGAPIKIVLMSDQQNREMFPATIEKLLEVEPDVDGVFFAGDFVDTPHRASEWFDRKSNSRPAFFPSMQGFYKEMRDTRWPSLDTSVNPYSGGPLLQNAWLFASIGNHEAPGLWRPGSWSLNTMDGSPQPRWYAEVRYEQNKASINPTDDPAIRAQWIQDNSYDITQYLEMWNHPEGPIGESYYAYRIGDLFVISMHVNRVWRHWNFGWPNDNNRGKFGEPNNSLNDPLNWGFGDMFFEHYDAGSDQYNWLFTVLDSEAFKTAKHRVVLAHQTGFGLGDNSVPVMADPVATIDYNDGSPQQIQVTYPMDKAEWESTIQPLLGSITGITYDYPLAEDVWKRDIEPLLLEHGVHLVHFGHSHIWNRARTGTLNYIETSNYGNTFGTAWRSSDRSVNIRRASWATFPQDRPDSGRFDRGAYPRYFDPHGRPAIFPNIANPENTSGEAPVEVPYVSSNAIGVFTVLDTGTGTVRSYAYPWKRDGTAGTPVLFDEFPLEIPSLSIKSTFMDAGNLCFTYERLNESALTYSYEGNTTLESGLWSPMTETTDYTESLESDLGGGLHLIKVSVPLSGDSIFVRTVADGLD